jgi:hypothetical protein
LYNSFTDVWEFVQVFFDACREEMKAKEVVVPAVAA